MHIVRRIVYKLHPSRRLPSKAVRKCAAPPGKGSAMRLLAKPLMYVAVASLAPACGSLAPNTNQPPVLATIHGELQDKPLSTLGAAADRTRGAVWWHGVHGFSIARAPPVQGMFPAQFVRQ